MPAVTRKGDICTGHSCFPPRNSTSGSFHFVRNYDNISASGHLAQLGAHFLDVEGVRGSSPLVPITPDAGVGDPTPALFVWYFQKQQI